MGVDYNHHRIVTGNFHSIYCNASRSRKSKPRPQPHGKKRNSLLVCSAAHALVVALMVLLALYSVPLFMTCKLSETPRTHINLHMKLTFPHHFETSLLSSTVIITSDLPYPYPNDEIIVLNPSYTLNTPYRLGKPYLCPTINKTHFRTHKHYITLLTLLYLTLLLLLLSSDIEINPGPNLDNENFSIFHANARSITSHPLKLAEIKHIISVDNPSIVSLSETWLADSVNPDKIKLENYTPLPLRKDRNRNGGGVIVYIREDINFKSLDDCQRKNHDSIWISVIHPRDNKKSIFGIFYRTPTMTAKDLDAWMVDFDSSISTAKTHPYQSLNLIGDFNAKNRLWYPEGDNNMAGILLYDILAKHGLSQQISEPTRIVTTKTGTSKSLLDLFITDSPTLTMSTQTYPKLYNCDHCPIIANMRFYFPTAKSFTKTFYDYEQLDENAVKSNFSHAAFDLLFDAFPNIDQLYGSFITLFSSIIDNAIPRKTIKINPRSQPWFSKTLDKLRNKMLVVCSEALRRR